MGLGQRLLTTSAVGRKNMKYPKTFAICSEPILGITVNAKSVRLMVGGLLPPSSKAKLPANVRIIMMAWQE